MTTEEKNQALNNALRSFGYRQDLFIHTVGKDLFIIASKNEVGGLNTFGLAYNYKEMNLFLKAYNIGFNNNTSLKLI
jgi:hypothetical protein